MTMDDQIPAQPSPDPGAPSPPPVDYAKRSAQLKKAVTRGHATVANCMRVALICIVFNMIYAVLQSPFVFGYMVTNLLAGSVIIYAYRLFHKSATGAIAHDGETLATPHHVLVELQAIKEPAPREDAHGGMTAQHASYGRQIEDSEQMLSDIDFLAVLIYAGLALFIGDALHLTKESPIPIGRLLLDAEACAALAGFQIFSRRHKAVIGRYNHALYKARDMIAAPKKRQEGDPDIEDEDDDLDGLYVDDIRLQVEPISAYRTAEKKQPREQAAATNDGAAQDTTKKPNTERQATSDSPSAVAPMGDSSNLPAGGSGKMPATVAAKQGKAAPLKLGGAAANVGGAPGQPAAKSADDKTRQIFTRFGIVTRYINSGKPGDGKDALMASAVQTDKLLKKFGLFPRGPGIDLAKNEKAKHAAALQIWAKEEQQRKNTLTTAQDDSKILATGENQAALMGNAVAVWQDKKNDADDDAAASNAKAVLDPRSLPPGRKESNAALFGEVTAVWQDPNKESAYEKMREQLNLAERMRAEMLSVELTEAKKKSEADSYKIMSEKLQEQKRAEAEEAQKVFAQRNAEMTKAEVVRLIQSGDPGGRAVWDELAQANKTLNLPKDHTG